MPKKKFFESICSWIAENDRKILLCTSINEENGYAICKYANTNTQDFNHWKDTIGIGFFILLCKSGNMLVHDMQIDRFDCMFIIALSRFVEMILNLFNHYFVYFSLSVLLSS